MASHRRLDMPASIDWRTLGTDDVAPANWGPHREQMAACRKTRTRKPRVTHRSRVPSGGERSCVTYGNCSGKGHNIRGCIRPAQAPKGSDKATGKGD